MNETLKEYFDALERLKANKPINIPKNSKINKDTVALEAGRKRGSIKKSREIFAELIEAIDLASEEKNIKYKKMENKISKLQYSVNTYKKQYEAALNRELMLLERINEIEKQLIDKKSLFINNKTYGQNI